MSSLNELRMSRYSSLAPSIDEVNVHVIGVGSIGRRVATELASMGVNKIWIYDFDVIDDENLGTQGWKLEDVGREKVEAVNDEIKRVNLDSVVTKCNDRFKEGNSVFDLKNTHDLKQINVVFLCVDSIESRKDIYELVRDYTDLLVDTRMAAEQVRVITLVSPEDDRYYEHTLFKEEEGLQERCTARSTAYAAMIAAGMGISKFTQFLRKKKNIVTDEIYNIRNSEITIMSEDGDVTKLHKEEEVETVEHGDPIPF